jgi:prephenate dehydratase
MKNVRIMDVGNTEEAARRISEFGFGGAGITSQEAVEKYHLTVLEEDIEDNIRNFTRFIILSQTFNPSIEDDKVSGVFILKNQPGALFQILKIFADAKINIVKLESRPIPGKPWEYLFYADWEGNIIEDRYKKTVQSLEKHTLFLRILGSYKNIWKK